MRQARRRMRGGWCNRRRRRCRRVHRCECRLCMCEWKSFEWVRVVRLCVREEVLSMLSGRWWREQSDRSSVRVVREGLKLAGRRVRMGQMVPRWSCGAGGPGTPSPLKEHRQERARTTCRCPDRATRMDDIATADRRARCSCDHRRSDSEGSFH
jgi:hypothetical protein